MGKFVTTLKIYWTDKEPDEDELDLALEYIIELIRQGYTSGYSSGNIQSWHLK